VVCTYTSYATVVLLAFWAVLAAELVGDRSMYALAALALRFRWAVVFAAFVIASAAKMAVAVVLSGSLIRIQPHWTFLISAIAFFVSAILIFWDEPPQIGQEYSNQEPWSKGALVCFSSFFFAEWADPGQIAAAALVLKSHLVLATWLGATVALIVKGVIALSVGLQIRDRIPIKILRLVSFGSCCALGILAFGESFMR
jgi:putative Ca2+/H+ antiporter (TMEM165/GDT1 family)